ncbi:MAG TPA: CpaD family pilus assembly protein [Sphingomonas sp.]|nr:CpaD family pilus assembly protein [Sphingomonas sp.]
MPKRSSILAVLAPTLLLAGCGGTVNRGLESVHQPVVSRSDFAFDVNTSSHGLAPGEADRLDGWLASMRLAYGDRVAIDDSGSVSPAARAAVAREVARYGLLLSNEAPVMPAPVTPGTLRVVVSRMTASVPGCPDHSRQATPDFSNNTNSNFGCATNSNLAAMVARPADLIRGQDGTDIADPAVSTKAIQTFREAPNTGKQPLPSQSTTQAPTGG